MNITALVKRVQVKANNLGANPPLEVDGKDGPRTWAWIADQLGVSISAGSGGIGDELADIAEGQLGTREDAAHQNAGSAILKYQQATSVEGQGWPWCAAFVDYCVQQLFSRHPELADKMARPRTPSAFGLINWGQDSGCLVLRPGSDMAQRGDIVVYQFSHCGIVADDQDGEGFFAIEGNSNSDGSRDGYAVVRHPRNLISVKRFIRIPDA